MSARYEAIASADGLSYEFITSSGDLYVAYFTIFTLLDAGLNEIEVTSFGFTCKRVKGKYRYDIKVKNTIVHLILEFFGRQGDSAILYLYINNDGRERNRHIAFGSWFNEMKSGFERHSSSAEQGKMGFYSSIIFKSNNPYRLKLIESFYFTIGYYWQLDES